MPPSTTMRLPTRTHTHITSHHTITSSHHQNYSVHAILRELGVLLHAAQSTCAVPHGEDDQEHNRNSCNAQSPSDTHAAHHRGAPSTGRRQQRCSLLSTDCILQCIELYIFGPAVLFPYLYNVLCFLPCSAVLDTTCLLISVYLQGLEVVILEQEQYPSGMIYHHNKRYIKAMKAHEKVPFVFHMCWTTSRVEKVSRLESALLIGLDFSTGGVCCCCVARSRVTGLLKGRGEGGAAVLSLYLSAPLIVCFILLTPLTYPPTYLFNPSIQPPNRPPSQPLQVEYFKDVGMWLLPDSEPLCEKADEMLKLVRAAGPEESLRKAGESLMQQCCKQGKYWEGFKP